MYVVQYSYIALSVLLIVYSYSYSLEYRVCEYAYERNMFALLLRYLIKGSRALLYAASLGNVVSLAHSSLAHINFFEAYEVILGFCSDFEHFDGF